MLNEYYQKRNFTKTSEPLGKVKQSKNSKKRSFVVQKHYATHLHYDFRLEIGPVLKSWAIPKGPSTKPNDKRLAINTEDHPLEYKDFKGKIPKGEYGAGSVEIWDFGEFLPNSDPEIQYQNGKLEFKLYGKKLKGNWVLLQLKKDPKNWLLIKLQDKL